VIAGSGWKPAAPGCGSCRRQRLLEGHIVAGVFEPVEVDGFLRALRLAPPASRDCECAKKMFESDEQWFLSGCCSRYLSSFRGSGNPFLPLLREQDQDGFPLSLGMTTLDGVRGNYASRQHHQSHGAVPLRAGVVGFLLIAVTF
jgi:hypothetical protein